VGECVAELIAEGVLSEQQPDGAAAGRGRRATLVTVRPADGVVLGIDLGHSHVSVAAARRDGTVLAERTTRLDVDRQPERALDTAAALAAETLTGSGHHGDDVAAIAVGIPGPLDVRSRTVRAPTILTDWVGMDPAAELGERLGRAVVVGNDADMGAIGEHRFGAARGLDDFLYVKASHGIGAGVFLGGRGYRGATGIAGEIGHTQIPGATELCRCGSRGCLESVVSIGSVRRQLAHVLAAPGTAVDEVDLPPLAELAGNSAAARVVCDAGRTIGRVVAALVNCLNPAAVVLGGELGAAGEPLLAGVRESIQRYAQPASADAAKVCSGQLGDRAELLGTIATAQQQAAV
jgi:predicted NBD/HSP70 family sugar kinase